MRENGADTEAEIVERYMEAAEKESVTLTRDEVMDELAADFAGDMLDDAALFAKFSKENRTAAQKLLDSLKEFLNKVRGLFTGKYRDMAAQEAYGKDFAELEDIAKQWQAAFDAAKRQAEKTKTAAGEGDGVRYSMKDYSYDALVRKPDMTLAILGDADGLTRKEVIDKALAEAEKYGGVANLLTYVNRYFPDVLPESVLRHFGHSERPAGKLGEGALFSLKAYSEAEKKGHVKSAKEFFGETNNWNETGYITTDGTKLDFSGRHEGAPGGQTGRRGDGRDRRGAV